MSDKMEALTLLLMFLTVSGYSYVLQPRLTGTQTAGLDRDRQSEMRNEQLRHASMPVEEKLKAAHSAEEKTSEGLTAEINPEMRKMEEIIIAGFTGNIGEILNRNRGYELGSEERSETFNPRFEEDLDKGEEKTREGRAKVETNEEGKAVQAINDDMDKLKQETGDEERESRLVAGISLQEETRGHVHEDGGKMVTVNHRNVEEQRGNEEREEGNVKNAMHNELVEREKEDHIVVSNLTPPLSTSSTQLGEEFEIPATLDIFTQSQIPLSSPSPGHRHNAPHSPLFTPTQGPLVPSHHPTPDAKVSPQRFPAPVTRPNPEVFQSPGHHVKRNELDVKAGPNIEDAVVRNRSFKPAQKEVQTTGGEINSVQSTEDEFIQKVQAATPNPNHKTKDLTENPTPKSNENNSTAELVEFRRTNTTQFTTKTVKLMENGSQPTKRRNKESPLQPQRTKASGKTAPSVRSTKINRSSKTKKIKKSNEKKRKNSDITKKPSKEVTAPTHFPYFMDNYCPPECACYGRVVQCSDKDVDNVPYGIPYNARYILLMNNHIKSIQLDLLSEYVSMEFLVLSNNQLKDGSIEGAFEGVPALKRLYLDRNLLTSVPTDLPVSLEELRLDSNPLKVMSEAAWTRCPGLLVLSLSNSSLGNQSDSLPNAVLSPLCKLRTLNLDHNQLTSVPQGLPLTIKELYLKGNLIEQFTGGAFDGISELVVLDLSANRLTNKGLLTESLLNATRLESLNLEGNQLKQVPQHLPRSLKALNLEGNLISSIKKAAFGTLINLEHLSLAKNKIFKVAPGAFRTLPILHQLDLCHNTLRQVPRQLPHALHSVALMHNKIQSVPRDAFCWGNSTLSRLVQVQLENNLIDMRKLNTQAFRCLRGFQVVHFY